MEEDVSNEPEPYVYTFNALHQMGKAVIMTSDTVPSEIPGLEDRLRRSFEAATINPAYMVPARVMVGLGGICFTLFSIVSILESGTSS